MAKPNPAQDQTMEEILASIRQIISEDDARRSSGASTRAAETSATVSRLFVESDPVDEPPPRQPHVDNVVSLAIEQAIGEARAEVAEAMRAPAEPPRPRPVETFAPAPRPTLRETRPEPLRELRPEPARETSALLSPRSDAAVSGSFSQLAEAMAAAGPRTIDDAVEGMLRPMLRAWLDTNLPKLVERLVREEIERVSRGRH